ncbi:MAG: hypothetical protein V4502_08080 [Pseudomonadota bacterium]
MKRHLPLILAAVALSFVGKYGFSSTTLDGARVITGSLDAASITIASAALGGTCTAPKLVISLSAATVPTCAGDATWTGMAAGCGGSCYSNSWTDFGMGLQVGSYWKDGFGVVHLRGIIAPGTKTASTTIITMPAGYRPPTDTLVYFHTDAGSQLLTLPQRISFAASTGTMVNTYAVGAGNVYLSLDGVTYATFN